MTETFFGADALPQAADWLRARGVQRPLLLCGESRRFVDDLRAVLPGEIAVFDRARVHVPADVVDLAADVLAQHGADAIVAVGGGSATGLGKALRLRTDVPFVAVPTTYSGSEMTRIFGILEQGGKRTGRDERVRPDAVAYVPRFLAALPARMAVCSAMNALAHPIAAGHEGDLAARLFRAVLRLAERPDDARAREEAARGAAEAGRVIDTRELGLHHRVAHLLGGRFDLPHAPLHALLLPHSMGAVDLPEADPPAALFDALRLVEAPTSLLDLGVDPDAAEQAVREALGDVPWLHGAMLGRRPSIHVKRVAIGSDPPLAVFGDLASATDIVVAIHGRGSTADAMLQLTREILGDAPHVAIVAPQADCNLWYEPTYRTARSEAADAIEAALRRIEAACTWAIEQALAPRVHVLGFSQGACLALELAIRSQEPFASVIAFAGALLGPDALRPAIAFPYAGMPVLLGAAEDDPRIDADAIPSAARVLTDAGAEVTIGNEPGDAHRLHARQRLRARDLVLGPREGSTGFGNAHHAEALPGALPLRQNSPRRAPYGLYAEQLSGTGFIAPRHLNRRTWLYRIRPSAGHRPLRPLPHPTFVADFVGRPPEVDLVGHGPLPLPDRPTDFVDGMHTYGGQGDPAQRRGFAIHLYAANRSMDQRAFYDADGDLLVLPELGAITVLTELGPLHVAPGHVALLPRGVKFSVLLEEGRARGYVGEVFGRSFTLPDRGVVGANGVADERHFRAPAPFFEDRLDRSYRLTVKHGGHLYETTLPRSPFDVVAWHGTHVPYVYDLSAFTPVGNLAYDHIDPSAYLVLTAPLDERGADSLDLVVFPARWDPTEHTFRPPFFHRNAITEWNAIVRERDVAGSPFHQGGCWLTPAMTAHGALDVAVERAIAMSDAEADAPVRIGGDSIWLQFETAQELALTPWARDAAHRIADWPAVWGRYRSWYRP